MQEQRPQARRREQELPASPVLVLEQRRQGPLQEPALSPEPQSPPRQ